MEVIMPQQLGLANLPKDFVNLFERPITTEDFEALKSLISRYFVEKEKEHFLSIEDIKQRYPNEWVLLGNPKIENTTILGGVVVYHSPDKRDLVKGRDALKGFELSTWTFTGTFPKGRRIWLGIHRKIAKTETL